MPNKRPIICIPDTNALIHLRGITVARRDACQWLWDEFDVKVSEEIPREAKNHQNKMPGGLFKKLDRSTEKLHLELDKMEKGFLASLGKSFNTLDDIGERHNSQLGLQLIIRNTARQVIFLTDEIKIVRDNSQFSLLLSARNAVRQVTFRTDEARILKEDVGFVKLLFDTYPIGRVWNTLDFLLYLYLRHTKFNEQEAEDALRTVNTWIGGKNEVMTQRLVAYTRRLKCISTARSQLNKLWGIPK